MRYTSYIHNGVQYINDSYASKYDVYGNIIPNKTAAEHEEEMRPLREASAARYDAFTVELKAKEAARLAKRAADPVVQAANRTREELKARAKELAKTITCTLADCEQWRVDNGYLWKAVSPKGTVYTEIIKQITIKDPEDYVTYNAMCIAAQTNVQ